MMRTKSNMRNNQDEWEVEDITEMDNLPSTTSTNNEDIYLTAKEQTSKRGILKQRSEASINISEFNLTEVGKEKIKLNELVKTSLKTTSQITQRNLQTVKKLKKLSTPLSKQRQEKIKRLVAYEKICDEVGKWESLVNSNRSADKLTFPLKKPDFQLQTLENVADNFISKHPVEIAVSELLEISENKLEPEKPLTVAEEKALQAMSALEAKERHAELMKHRALISYQEAKARHKNKIKSKRYHRILKKEKLKKAMKEFEHLHKSDADMALQKLAQLDKLRILERMTLKHRNTGKWAKQQKIRAKYNPESRDVLKEDLAVGRQLREKVDLPQHISSCKTPENDFSLVEEKYSDDEEDNNKWQSSELSAVDESVNFIETPKPISNQFHNQVNVKVKGKDVIPSKDTVDDIMEFVSKEQCLDSAIPDAFTLGEEDIDEVMEDIVPMSEAYGDEECVDEFRREKEASEKKPEGIDLFLPGWGNWGGPGIKPSKKKMKQFFIRPPTVPLKKNTLGNVIIHEDKDKKASMHQVSHLPFPFTNVGQFESYIRQPVGHTWNPQNSFQNLVAPKVVTKMGKVIEPLDAEDLVLENKKLKKGKQSVRELKAF